MNTSELTTAELKAFNQLNMISGTSVKDCFESVDLNKSFSKIKNEILLTSNNNNSIVPCDAPFINIITTNK